MINIRSIIKLTEGDGFTLKAGKKIQYKTGYQVAFEGIETTSAREAIKIGTTFQQISIYDWKRGACIYLK